MLLDPKELVLLSPDQIVTHFYKVIAIPGILITFISFFFISFVLGLIFVKKDIKKFVFIISLSALFTAIIVGVLILNPTLSLKIASWFTL